MTIQERIADEFKRGPVTVSATVAGVLVALLALLVAWLQYAGTPVVSSVGSVAPASQGSLHLSNLLVAIAFFLAASLSLASLIHILERSHPFHAIVLSVPAAVLSAFLTLLVIRLAPPRTLTAELFDRANDLVFWATLFVFVAMNGRSAVKDLAQVYESKESADPSSGPKEELDDGFAFFFVLLIMLAIWGSLVSAGLSKLSKFVFA